jgi:hypothetical protein
MKLLLALTNSAIHRSRPELLPVGTGAVTPRDAHWQARSNCIAIRS